MKKFALFAAGPIRSYDFVKKTIAGYNYIICCDRGLKHVHVLKHEHNVDITPSVILGDFDSLEDKYLDLYKNAKIIRYSTDKDFTDTQLGIEYCMKHNASEILIFGAMGGRFDHTLDNFYGLITPIKAGIKTTLIDEQNKCTLTLDEISIKKDHYKYISLLPLTSHVEFQYTYGLKYALNDGQKLSMETFRGTSNEFTTGEAKIKIKNGILAVILSHD